MKILTPPRNVPDRDSYYMGLAFWVASKSKDPNTQCGSVLIDFENVPLSNGYNGMPKKIDDRSVSWGRPEKLLTMVHAEINAIKHSRGSTTDATMYVTARPCPACMLSIVDAEISRVVWFPIKTDPGSMLANEESIKKTEEIASLGRVSLEKFNGNLNWMRDRIKQMEENGIFD